MAFWGGLLLGFSMILPIGAQNLFVLNSGLLGGPRRGLVAAITAGCCDTALILVGAAGLSGVLARAAGVRLALLALGVAFLGYLGVAALRAAAKAPAVAPANLSGSVGTAGTAGAAALPVSPWRQVLMGVGVSWGNPHAILDTVAVIGGTIAAQGVADRTPFAAGAVTASWLFFLLLWVIGGFFGARLPPGAHRWIGRFSGAVMLLFAVALLVELVRSVV